MKDSNYCLHLNQSPVVAHADLLKAIVDTVTTAIGSRSTSPLFSVEEAFTGLIEKGRP